MHTVARKRPRRTYQRVITVMAKVCGIYLITNNVTGKQYIGQSIDICKRWKQHLFCNRRYPLYSALRKYGAASFTFEVLVECRRDHLDFFEVAFILGYGTLSPHGYNLTTGGGSGKECSPETREKLRAASTGRAVSIETRQKMGDASRGRTHTTETKKKMSKAQKGVSRPNQQGKHHSEETKKKMSDAHKGKTKSAATKQKIRDAHADRAAKKKMIAASRKRYAWSK